MERYIGLDAHSQSCTFAVLNERGKEVKQQVVETNGECLVEFLKLVPGRRHLCLEEGTQSLWLFEILKKHVHTIAVVHGRKRRGNKSDATDAFDLAERIRTGQLGHPIYKPPKSIFPLRELVRTHGMLTKDVTRTKNRIKSFYRARGLSTEGRGRFYKAGLRDATSHQLHSASRYGVDLLSQQLDHLVQLKQAIEDGMLTEAGKNKFVRILKTVPGIGPVRSAQLLAIVVSPHRFRTSRQFWAYCGLAVVTHSSADWVMTPDRTWVRGSVTHTRGLNRNYNRDCKAIFKDAATTVLAKMPSNPLCSDYERLLTQGTKPNLAKLTIARKIAAMTLSMWKKQEVYNPAKYRKR